MQPYFTQDGIELYHGNCLEVLPELARPCAGVLLTSPPFKDEDVGGDYWAFYDSFMQVSIGTAARARIIIQSPTRLNDLILRYPPKRVMIWGKGISQYSYRFNPILVYQDDPDYSVNRRIWTDCIGVQSLFGGNKCHIYQDPLQLYITILTMFRDAGSVLDPFAGSGTTLRAAQELGIPGVGIEQDERNCELAAQRLTGLRPQHSAQGVLTMAAPFTTEVTT